MFDQIPHVTATTPEQRLQALKDARDLISGENPKTGLVAAFAGGDAPRGAGAKSAESMIRLAEYITTGHDYKDTHPHGDDFTEAMALERFQRKQRRKDHDNHHRHHGDENSSPFPPGVEGILAGGIPVSREFVERLQRGEVSGRDIADLVREYLEHPREQSDEDQRSED